MRSEPLETAADARIRRSAVETCRDCTVAPLGGGPAPGPAPGRAPGPAAGAGPAPGPEPGRKTGAWPAQDRGGTGAR